MTTIQQLKEERNQLYKELKADNSDLILKKIKDIDKEIHEMRIAERLERVNAEQERKRKFAFMAWEAEQPSEDITTQNGSFHATKVKKYPKLAALPYCRATFEHSKITELKIEGYTFYLCKWERESNEKQRFASIEEFLRFNAVMSRDIELTEYKDLIEKTKKINEEFKEACNKLREQKTALELSLYAHIGLFSQQRTEYIYQFEPNLY